MVELAEAFVRERIVLMLSNLTSTEENSPKNIITENIYIAEGCDGEKKQGKK